MKSQKKTEVKKKKIRGKCLVFLQNLSSLSLSFSTIATGVLILKNNAATLVSMMMIAFNRYILIVKGRVIYDKLYTKRNTALSIVVVRVSLDSSFV